jgi:deoxycytidine triphosphate deaminase
MLDTKTPILVDYEIDRLVKSGQLVIEPFLESKVSQVVDTSEAQYSHTVTAFPSKGLSSMGYDVSLGKVWKVPKPMPWYARLRNKVISVLFGPHDRRLRVVDTSVSYRQFPPDSIAPPLITGEADARWYYESMLEEIRADSIVIPPGGFALAVTRERIGLPSGVMAVCMAKSTLARIGLEAAVTPIEPGWEGYVTIELYNKCNRPIRVNEGIGVMQLIFLNSGKECRSGYSQDGVVGKYADQPAAPVAARLVK